MPAGPIFGSDIMKISDIVDNISYRTKDIEIFNENYTISIFSYDEDLNVFDGILIKYVDYDNKKEVDNLINRYRPPVSGYSARIIILYNDNDIMIRDCRRNIYFGGLISDRVINRIMTFIRNPTEDNISRLLGR